MALFLHVLVAEHTRVLAEALHSDAPSDVASASRSLLHTAARTPSPNTRRVRLERDNGAAALAFCYSRVSSARTVACVCDATDVPAMAARRALQRLEQLLADVERQVPEGAFALGEALSGALQDVLRELNAQVGAASVSGGVAQAQRKVIEATDAMRDTAERLSEREAMLGDTSNALDDMASVQSDYQAYTAQLRERERARKLRSAAGFACIFLFVLIALW
eukprot:TRINITY_DN4751_c0_g1_i2.p1 TRINITY_DN4751_c0_g1~~TRINITY_DN4751_c0_g1_i2.p1  ORF type:complete len:239 (+),score=77.39 TRINITY_DN4751_c0_g1_i2:55-717(+)